MLFSVAHTILMIIKSTGRTAQTIPVLILIKIKISKMSQGAGRIK